MADHTTSSTNSNPTWSEPWLFASAAVAMFALGILLFAALRIFSGVFQQARDGAVEALLIQSAAIGVIVMASIQTVRSIVPVRSWFHRTRVSVWLGRAPDELKVPKEFEARMRQRIETDGLWLDKYIGPDTTEKQILDRLLQLTTAEGSARPAVSRAFFDLPLEQLCGQISAGAERAIVDPRTNGAILLRLANAAGEEDVLSFFTAHRDLEPTPRPKVQPPSNRHSGCLRHASRGTSARRGSCERVPAWRNASDAASIAFKSKAASHWRRRLRAIAVMLAAALGLTAALIGNQFLASVPVAIASGIVGGFFAMLARDLTAIVERLRRVP